jgi:hypothetical protein
MPWREGQLLLARWEGRIHPARWRLIHVPVRAGGGYYGRVFRYRGTFIETLFFHIWFVPILPIGSVVVLIDDAAARYDRAPVRMSLTSVVAAYLRIWPLLLGGGLLASWWGAWWWYASWSGGLGIAAISLGLVALGLALGLFVPSGHRAAMDRLIAHKL